MKFRIPRRTKTTSNRGQYGKVLSEVNKRKAQAFAEGLRPTIMEVMLNAGSKNARRPKELAEALNAKGVPSALGGKWCRETVRRLLNRLGPEYIQEFRSRQKERLELRIANEAPSGREEYCRRLWKDQ